eukprot:gene9308-10274_t
MGKIIERLSSSLLLTRKATSKKSLSRHSSSSLDGAASADLPEKSAFVGVHAFNNKVSPAKSLQPRCAEAVLETL